MTPILKIVRMVTGEAPRWRPVSPSIGGNRISRRSPFAEGYSDMIRNVHNGECCVRTYGTNSERRLRTLSLMVASGLMPFGFRRQYDWSLMGYPV